MFSKAPPTLAKEKGFDMTGTDKASFEPFVTLALGSVRQPYSSSGTTKIALSSNAPGVTAIHWYDAPAARRLVAELQILIDRLDPPPAVPVEAAKAKRKPRAIQAAKPRKAKRK